MSRSGYSRDDAVRVGREIYDREIRDEVEPAQDGEFVAIDVESGAWELAEDGLSASRRVLAREPDAVVCLLRVGHHTAYRIGAPTLSGTGCQTAVMNGTVNASGEAMIPVEVHSPSGAFEVVESVLDTGFTGYLTLPRTAVDSLSLPLLSFTPVTLADGSVANLDVHEALVIWHGRQRAVECLVAEGAPLVGMALLQGSMLRVEVTSGGAVQVEEMAF